MWKKTGFILLIALLISIPSKLLFAQDPVTIGKYKLPAIVIGEDTFPVVNLPLVSIVDFADPEVLKNLQAYYRLRFNVIKVYPYAKLAAAKLNEMNQHAATLKTQREKRRYIKETEKQVKKDFEDQVKNLSINQGNVLIKLIYRETGSTSYELIKELRGSFNAFFAQGLAKLFGHDLKSIYDPAGEDKTIENIVQQIESGQINN